MSFLDESSATLQEALAFIDACDSSLSKRKPRARSSSYWQRLRAETQQLRLETTTLEATLQRLQAKAHTHVEREYHRRRHAETTNQQLRALIRKNHEVISAAATISHATTGHSSLIMSALVDRLNRREMNAMATLDRAGLLCSDSVLLRTQHESDPFLGSVVVSVSSTPLLISKTRSDLALWRRFSQELGLAPNEPELCRFMQEGLLESIPANFFFKGERFNLTTSMMSRRKVHKQCVLYVWTATTPIPSKRMSLVEESFICLRDPLSPCKHAALVQYWYRIHVEPSYPMSHGDPAELELMKECALRWRSSVSTSYVQSLDAMLAGESENDKPDAQVSFVAAGLRLWGGRNI